MKTVIVDLKGKYAAALTESGEVKKIVNHHYTIGDEIELYDIREVKHRTFPRAVKRIAAVAAAVIVLATGSVATAYALPYGTVTIDGEASIEYTVNCFDYVLDVKALNEDGEAILSEIDLSSLRHHKVDDAVGTTVEQIERDGYLDEDGKGISVTASTGNDQHTDRLQQDIEDRVFNDMGVPQTPAQTADNVNQVPDNNTPDNNPPADDGQQNQEQEQSPNRDQQKDNTQQDEARQDDSPHAQDDGNTPEQNAGQKQNNVNQPQMQPKQ